MHKLLERRNGDDRLSMQNRKPVPKVKKSGKAKSLIIMLPKRVKTIYFQSGEYACATAKRKQESIGVIAKTDSEPYAG